MYELDKIRKEYSGVRAIRCISLSIPTDGLVVIMGPSGSGKSTLLRLLSFVEQPDSGTVNLLTNERIFSSAEVDRPWPAVTCVFQKLFLWTHLTLFENIALPLRHLAPSDRQARLDSVIELFDMKAFVRRFPNEVSGGQAQRAALARALALRPKVVLIDEAHTGLDLEQQYVLNKHFIALRSEGVGLIVVSHAVDFAYRYADYIAVIEDGNLTECGTREELEFPQSRYLKYAVNQMKP